MAQRQKFQIIGTIWLPQHMLESVAAVHIVGKDGNTIVEFPVKERTVKQGRSGMYFSCQLRREDLEEEWTQQQQQQQQQQTTQQSQQSVAVDGNLQTLATAIAAAIVAQLQQLQPQQSQPQPKRKKS